MSESGFVPPYRPIDLPVAGPDVDPATGSLVYVRFNVAWRKYLLGAAAALLDPKVWTGTESEVNTAIQQARSLMYTLQADQPLIIFRQSEECGLEASYDGGDTWQSIYDPATCLADFGNDFLLKVPSALETNLVVPPTGIYGIQIQPTNAPGLVVFPLNNTNAPLIDLYTHGTGAALQLRGDGSGPKIVTPNGAIVTSDNFLTMRVQSGDSEPTPDAAHRGVFYLFDQAPDTPYFIAKNGATYERRSLIGPTGATGATGATGEKGDQGDPGIDGTVIESVTINPLDCDTVMSGSISGTTLVLNLHDPCLVNTPDAGSQTDPACSVATYVSDFLISKYEDSINLLDEIGNASELVTGFIGKIFPGADLITGFAGILVNLATGMIGIGSTTMRAQFTTEMKADAKCSLYCLLFGENPPDIDSSILTAYKSHLHDHNVYEFWSFVSLYSLATFRRLAEVGIQFDSVCADCDCDTATDVCKVKPWYLDAGGNQVFGAAQVIKQTGLNFAVNGNVQYTAAFNDYFAGFTLVTLDETANYTGPCHFEWSGTLGAPNNPPVTIGNWYDAAGSLHSSTTEYPPDNTNDFSLSANWRSGTAIANAVTIVPL